ncbi:polymerase (DNA directed) [Mactra antiquata]
MTSKHSAKLGKLLLRTGFIHQIKKNGVGVFVNGPNGALLRQNIFKTWWDRMVSKSESSFPVYGQNIDPLQLYPHILELQSENVPFSIVYTPQISTHNTSIDNELQKFLIFNEETCLHFNHFCSPASVNQIYDQVVNCRLSWWKQYSCKASNFTTKNISEDNTRPGLHIQYKFPWGPVTIETINNLGQDNIEQIHEETGKQCKFHNGKKAVYPYQIECRSTIEMAMAVFLNDAYKVTENNSEVLQLHPAIASFKVAILRDGEKRRQIQEVTTYIGRELRKNGLQIIDTQDRETSFNKQIARHDEMGIPFTVIVDDSTIDTGAIRLRNRDTTIKETLAINKLVHYVTRHVTYDTSS